MSTAAVLAQEPIRRITRAEYETAASLGWFVDERVELLEGVISVMSPQGEDHQWSMVTATKYLIRMLGDRADVRPQLPFGASDDSEPEPDLAVTSPGALGPTPTQALLVIEISDSSLRRDRDLKTSLYARANVPEYWIVDTNRRVVEVRTKPTGTTYARLETYERSQKVRPVAFADLELDLAYFIPPAA